MFQVMIKDSGTSKVRELESRDLGASGGATGTPANRSGTIAAGGTAQQLAPANASRIGFSLRNLSTADLWFNELGGTAAAAQPSMRLAAGEYYETPISYKPTALISIFGATTGQAFTAREW